MTFNTCIFTTAYTRPVSDIKTISTSVIKLVAVLGRLFNKVYYLCMLKTCYCLCKKNIGTLLFKFIACFEAKRESNNK